MTAWMNVLVMESFMLLAIGLMYVDYKLGKL